MAAILQKHPPARALDGAGKHEVFTNSVPNRSVAADRLIGAPPHQHELSGRHRLMAFGRLHGAQILAEAEQIKPTRHDHAFGEALQFLPRRQGQQIEVLGGGRSHGAGDQRRLGPYVGVDEAQPLGPFAGGTCADPTGVRFANPARGQRRTAQHRNATMLRSNGGGDRKSIVGRMIVDDDDT